LSSVAAERDMTTVAAAISISSDRTARCRTLGERTASWTVATAGTARARAKSRTNSPSSPPQIPDAYWIETTSTQAPSSRAARP
jgi:hypothetical protein